MAIELPNDFKEFLKLLNSYEVEYLLVGGYAVGYYGYPRATGDMDIWIAVHLIDLAHLKQNKQAAGRYKDLDDLDNLP